MGNGKLNYQLSNTPQGIWSAISHTFTGRVFKLSCFFSLAHTSSSPSLSLGCDVALISPLPLSHLLQLCKPCQKGRRSARDGNPGGRCRVRNPRRFSRGRASRIRPNGSFAGPPTFRPGRLPLSICSLWDPKTGKRYLHTVKQESR